MIRRAIITYEGLPLSSGNAHSLGDANCFRSWSKVKEFILNCATETDEPELAYLLAVGKNTSSRFTLPLRAKFTAKYGFPDIPIQISSEETHYRWRFKSNDIEREIGWLESKRPLPNHIYNSPLALGIYFHLNFKPLSGEGCLPFQDPKYYLSQCIDERSGLLLGQSSLGLNLSTKSTLFAFFSLPFEELDDSLFTYIEFLRKWFPTKMSMKHWKIWRLNKTGTRCFPRKIDFNATVLDRSR